MENVFTKKDPLLDVINQVVLGEKKLTDAELKKREEIAQAIERENPGMDMGKKMAIATAQAKKVAEAYAHDGDNFDYKDSERGAAGVIHPDKAKHYKVGEHAFFYDHGTGNRVAGKVMKKDSKQIHIKHIGKIKKFKISRTHTPQADDFDEEVEQIEEGRYLRYDGHVNGKHYSVHVPEHKSIGDYSDSALHKKIAKENPHLHHHEVKAIVHSGGEEDSHVKVSHGGKTYKHHVYNEPEPDYVHESVEQIDELSKGTLGKYISKAVVDVHNDAKWAGETDDRDAKNKAFKRLLGVKSAAARLGGNPISKAQGISGFRREELELDESMENLSLKQWSKIHRDHHEFGGGSKASQRKMSQIEKHVHKKYGKEAMHKMIKDTEDYASGGRISNFRREEVDLEEQLENFWGAYLTCLDEAKDDASQQAILLRAMAKDPSDLMKMKRAIAMGDKALTNPVMRQEILKMLDQMMNLTVTDKALLQKTRSSFMKQKQFKAVDTTTTEEYVPEEVEELDEANIPVHHVNKAVSKVLGTKGAVRFAMHHRPGTEKHTSWDKVNSALMKQGVKTKHIAAIAAHLKPAQYNEEVEELDERNKENALRRKMMDASRGARWKVQNKMTADDVRDWDGKHKTNQAQNKAIGRALRNEEVEELDELSKGTLGNYIKKAATGMNGMAVHAHMSGSASSAEQREKHFDKAFKRGKGISKAADKLTKEEVEELDEISKKTLGSYIKKASGEAVQRAHAQVNAERGAEANPKVGVWKDMAKLHQDKKWKRMTGIRKAADKLTKEETEQVDEAGYDFTHYRKMQYAQARAAQKADDKPPFEGGREVKSSKPAAERVKKIAKGMQKKYTKKD